MPVLSLHEKNECGCLGLPQVPADKQGDRATHRMLNGLTDRSMRTLADQSYDFVLLVDDLPDLNCTSTHGCLFSPPDLCPGL